MRTPSSALPAWPNGFVDGFGSPFAGAAFAAGLRSAVARVARRAVRAARCSAATRLRSFASAFFGMRSFLLAGFAPGARAAARLAARRAAAAFRLTRTTALFPRFDAIVLPLRCSCRRVDWARSASPNAFGCAFGCASLFLLQRALRVEVAAAAALAAGRRIDHRVDQGRLAGVHGRVHGALELVRRCRIGTDPAERLHHLVVARTFDEYGRRRIRTGGVGVGAAIDAVVVEDDDADRQAVAADRLDLHAGEAEGAVAFDCEH